MIIRDLDCTVTESTWLTPTILSIRFKTDKKIIFQPGQFLTMALGTKNGLDVERRCYSFACSLAQGLTNGYEICVRYITKGLGSEFLASLRPGDHFRISAPFGDFRYRIPEPDRDVVFIGSGSGLAPFRSIVSSQEFQWQKPNRATLLQGARNEGEILYPGYFEKMGVETIPCVTHPQNLKTGFWGRVTDFLERENLDWNWQNTDFYICGGEKMVLDVLYILKFKRGVPRHSIFTENFRSNLLVPPVGPTNVILLRPTRTTNESTTPTEMENEMDALWKRAA